MSAYAVYLNERGDYEAGPDGATKVRVCGTATLEGAGVIAAMWNEDRKRAIEARGVRIGRHRPALVTKEEA